MTPADTIPQRLAEVANLPRRSGDQSQALIVFDEDLNRESILDFLIQESRPVIIRKYLDKTPLADLSFETLRERAGHHWLSAADKPRIASKVYADSLDAEPMLLRDYLDQEVLSPGPARPEFYERYRNLRVSKEFRADLCLIRPLFVPRDDLNQPCVWIGKGGTSTCLHTDPNDNFVFMCIGRKRFHLFPPQDLKWLYLGQVSSSSLLTSPVDPRNPDLGRYPDFRNTSGSVVDLQQGDLFFLPLGWAHFVESPESSFTYNYWVKPDATPFFKRKPSGAAICNVPAVS
jgi:hypothetical protein